MISITRNAGGAMQLRSAVDILYGNAATCEALANEARDVVDAAKRSGYKFYHDGQRWRIERPPYQCDDDADRDERSA